MNYEDNGLNLNQLTNNNELEVIDISEFENLVIDETIYDKICSNNNDTFSFESTSGEYTLNFEKVKYILSEKVIKVEYVVFKPTNYIFYENDVPTYNNMLLFDIDDEHKTLTLIDDPEIILGIFQENNLLEYINGLKVIDIDEFRELEIDDSILDNIADENYNKPFRFETKSHNFVLEFEREYFVFDTYIVFKAKSHIFIEDEFPIIENLLIYEIDEDNPSILNLVEDGPTILDIIGDLYSGVEDELDEEDNEISSETNNNDNTNNFDYDSLFEPTEDLYDKLFDDNYNGTLVVKTHEGKTIIYKKIGKVDYKKTTYFIMQFLDKFSKKEKYDYIVYKYENSNLATVFKKRLHKKILKIYSKQHKVKLK